MNTHMPKLQIRWILINSLSLQHFELESARGALIVKDIADSTTMATKALNSPYSRSKLQICHTCEKT